MTKKIFNAAVGVIIGVVFLVLTFKDKSIAEIISSVKQADMTWVAINGICLLLTFFLRSYRWKVLIENAGAKAKTQNVFYSVIMGYTVNTFTPKLGEIVRCVGLKETDNVKTSVGFGTVVTERIYDLLVLAIGIFFCFVFEIDRLLLLFRKTFVDNGFVNIDQAFKIIIVALLFIIVLTVLFFFLKKAKVFRKLNNFLFEIYFTVKKSFRLKKYKIFILLTLAIWIVLILMNYACLKALPSTENYSIYFAAIILFIAGIGWALPSPGGIGTTHFFILQIFLAFNLDENSGLAFGVLSNGLTLIFTWLIGVVAIVFSVLRKSLNRSSV